MDKTKIANLKSQFDVLSHLDSESGAEYWSARKLMPFLGYERWENFHKVINKTICTGRIVSLVNT